MLAINVVSNVSNSKMLALIVKSNTIKSSEQNYIKRVKSLMNLIC